ncbi:MAG: efflux RND transporter periplasmic adaptor subunit [Candidatus Omnitrophica bacterium]|nr:efflux RND transporter periplasmic adaptor subunit [Candidatus Omnitrophota bacterium]MBU4458251.1 efflux RND transporter periplasmic adaptor subunit [Candidatus Omnitrophota bacterium]
MKNILIIVFISILMLAGCNQSKTDEIRTTGDDIRYYTCGMHPSVKVSVEEYNKGNKSCPICNMNLTPVYKEGHATSDERRATNDEYYGCGMEGVEHVFLIKEIPGMKFCPICGMPLKKLSKDESDKLKGVVSTVKIKGNEIRLAGVQAESVKKLHLYKEIRTVGRVAYDPGLAISQEEFIAALEVFDKIQQGNIEEINERALNLVESSKRKLRLLGLSEDQIAGLEEKREVQTSLILPEEKMWIYGDVYEYELGWVKVDGEVKVTTSSLPGEEFHGVISSINPVLDPKTRSLRFRVEVDNPDLKLKPEMYVDVIIMSMYMGPEGEREVLAIPKNAVLDTGVRKIVWINQGNDTYEGRIIKIGPEATSVIDGAESKFYPVLSGLKEGEMVVTKANFLIDSQSQLSGVAAAAYGGALGAEEKKAPVHQH